MFQLNYISEWTPSLKDGVVAPARAQNVCALAQRCVEIACASLGGELVWRILQRLGKETFRDPGVERCFPRTLHDQSMRSFLWSGFVFSRITIPLRSLHHQSSWNRLCDSSEFINNEKKKFLFQKPLSEWMCLHFRLTIRKNRPRIPLTTTNPSQPGPFFKHRVNQTPAGMMTWLRRSAGDLLRVTAKSATFEKALDITESLKLTFKHDNGFSHQPNENSFLPWL